MVEGADVIARARAGKYLRRAEAKSYGHVTPAGVEMEFRVVEVLKGEGVPSTLTIHGHLIKADDFNDRPVPYDFVRPGGRGGMCSAYEYKKGGEYLLFLRSKGGRLTPYWYALAPVNEQLRSAEDPWLIWVKERLTRGSAAVQRHRPQIEHKPPQVAWLPDAARMLQRVLVSVALQS